jgi:hypothetical protein
MLAAVQGKSTEARLGSIRSLRFQVRVTVSEASRTERVSPPRAKEQKKFRTRQFIPASGAFAAINRIPVNSARVPTRQFHIAAS